MGKFYGKIGYAIMAETAPDTWQEEIQIRNYYGDVIRSVKKWENGQGLNDDLNISNELSIVADAFAYQHFHEIRYVEWYGAKWKVRNVEVQRPRLVLSIGGVYNDQKEDAYEDTT